jgi:hypothetical protein
MTYPFIGKVVILRSLWSFAKQSPCNVFVNMSTICLIVLTLNTLIIPEVWCILSNDNRHWYVLSFGRTLGCESTRFYFDCHWKAL